MGKILSDNKVSDLILRFSGVIALTMGLYHLYCGFFGQPEAFLFRSTFVTFVLVLCFLFNPLGGKFWKGKFDLLFIINFLFVLLPILIQIYIIFNIQAWYIKFGNLTNFDVVIQTTLIVVILEATRRTIGLPMTMVAIFFLINARFANYMPGVFYGPPMVWEHICSFVCMQEMGIYGSPVRVIGSIVTLFMIFSALLQKSKFINVFLKVAYAISGTQVGGPAKAAVVASAIMGTMSGSATANVAITGSFTIPLMKRLGYKPYFAAAVEAIASTGGQIMPPIMGATAFIIAEFLGVSYLKICIYAAIPAILYFSSLFLSIHFQSIKAGMAVIPKSKLPSLSKTLKQGGHLLFSVGVLFYFLFAGYSVQTAIMSTIVVTFFLAMIKKETRLTPKSFLCAIQDGAKAIISVGVACSCAGIIISTVLISGTGWRISNLILSMSGKNLWLAYLLSMIICFILGMGMTTTAVYLIAATLIIPNLLKLGIVPPAANLFAFYFGVISCITPPVALASFTAASIAGSRIGQTSIHAFIRAIPIFLIPFLFVQYPELLLIKEGTWFRTLIVIAIISSSIIFLVGGISGWFFRKLNFYERILMIILIVFVLVQDVRNPRVMFIYLIISALLIFLQKVFSYNKKLDNWFFRFSKLLYKKQNSDEQLTDIQQINKRIEQLEKIDFGDISISKKENINWLGWLVWGCLFFILSIMAKNYYAINHFGFFLLILLFLSFLVTIIIGFLNKKDID